jgi:SAM-dependent methyltransferase
MHDQQLRRVWDPDAQERISRSVYHAPDIARHYQTRGLSAPETAALLKYQSAFAGRDVLDLGVGTGRTTWYLQPLARRYLGVDYSPGMVQSFRAAMPEVEVRQADIRDLSELDSGSFDFVLGSSNVLDALSHFDRLSALREARRVLRTGGLFAFSSHNRGAPAAFRGPRLTWSKNPVNQALHVLVYLRRLINHSRLRRLRRSEPEYALLNDAGHDYSLLHYYIDRESQREQLERAGLRLIDVFDAEGRVADTDNIDPVSSSLFYVCRR